MTFCKHCNRLIPDEYDDNYSSDGSEIVCPNCNHRQAVEMTN